MGVSVQVVHLLFILGLAIAMLISGWLFISNMTFLFYMRVRLLFLRNPSDLQNTTSAVDRWLGHDLFFRDGGNKPRTRTEKADRIIWFATLGIALIVLLGSKFVVEASV